MLAAMFDRVEAMELLLARGADPRRRDARGVTALDLARGMGAERAVEVLRRYVDGSSGAARQRR
jgi:ankyrin repeat protein